jgi:NAD(P)-dependent dehydrogenase (short-subunit alcohol dehydrogenase family)
MTGSMPPSAPSLARATATAAFFLACDDSSYVNGTELGADGGTTAI